MLKKRRPEPAKQPSSSSEEEDSEEEEQPQGGRKILIKEDRNKFHTFGKEQRPFNRIDEEQEEENSSEEDYEDLNEEEEDKEWRDNGQQSNSYDSDVLVSKKKQPQESDEEESMDYIEQRIKKLEVELEQKLQKSRYRPPLSNGIPKEEPKPAHFHNRPKDKKVESLAVQTSDFIKKDKPKVEVEAPPQKQPQQPPKPVEPPPQKESAAKSKSPLRRLEQNSSIDEYRRQAEQLRQSAVLLRKENDRLRRKIRKQESNKRGLTKERIEIVQLQKIVSSAQATKLEKELELIDILEAIKLKLKKSISKKVAKLNDASDKQRSLKDKAMSYLAK